MGTSIAGLLVWGMLLTAVLLLGRATIFSNTLVGISSREAAELAGERARTMLSIASTTATSTDLMVQVANTGSTPIADVSKMDFIVQYESTSGQTVIKRLSRDTTAVTYFSDSFDRPDSGTVGNGWIEVETGGSEVLISNNTLDFKTVDNGNDPRVLHTFPSQSSGSLSWTFEFNWERNGPENYYELWMQLGDSSLMLDPDVSDNAGVAVNLLWAGDGNGMATDDGFGYVNGATVTQVATVNGGPSTADEHSIEVEVDLNNNTFDISIDGVPRASGVPFDNNVGINAIRIYSDKVSNGSFGSRYFDDILIGKPQGDDTWSVVSISPDDFEPGILNPGETMELSGKLVSAIKSGTSGTVAVVSPNGVAVTAYFPN